MIRAVGSSDRSWRANFTFVKRTRIGQGSSEKVTLYELLEVPVYKLTFLEQQEQGCYARHDHSTSNPIFRVIDNIEFGQSNLGVVPNTAISRQCVFSWRGEPYVGSIFGKLGETISFWCFSLSPPYSEARQFPSPICNTRFGARAFALGDKFLLWGGLISHENVTSDPFGECFNGITWTPIKRPPESDPLIGTKSKLFVASLGEYEKKFMIYDSEYLGNNNVYLYHVVRRTWTFYTNNPSPRLEPTFIFMNHITSNVDGHIYWLDKRRGMIYALNWQSMEVYSGAIVGAQHLPVLYNMEDIPGGVQLNHVLGSLFCLTWSISSTTKERTEDHYTFLKLEVDSNPSTGLLKAFVVGCFLDSHPLTPRFIDTACF